MSIDQTDHVKIMSSKTQPSNAEIKLIHETDQSNFPFDLNFKASIINTHRGILLERLEEAESKYLCRVNTLDMATDHVDEVQADLDKARAYTCRLYDRLRKTVHRERVKHNRIREMEAKLERVQEVVAYAKHTESIHAKAFNLYLLIDVRQQLEKAILENKS